MAVPDHPLEFSQMLIAHVNQFHVYWLHISLVLGLEIIFCSLLHLKNLRLTPRVHSHFHSLPKNSKTFL